MRFKELANFADIKRVVVKTQTFKPSSFKSNEHIYEIVDGSYRGFGDSSLISDNMEPEIIITISQFSTG